MFTIKAQENIQWTLEQCIEYAVENNINVNEAIISQKSSEITYNQSKVALFPNLSASASYNLTNGSSIDPITSEYVQQLVNSANASIGSRVTLYSGSQLINTIKKNRLSWEQSQLSVDYTKNNSPTSLYGVNQDYLTIRKYNIDNGEMFTDHDIKSSAKVCIVGQTVVENLFTNGEDPVGRTIRFNKIPFKIIGVLEEKGDNTMG